MKKSTQLINLKSSHTEVSNKKILTVNPPIFHASTVLFERCEDLYLANEGLYEGSVYGTDRLPLQIALEDAINELEEGALTRLFPSGLSAISNAYFAYIRSGDHVLICDNAYAPGASFCSKELPKFNIEVEFIPSNIGADIVNYVRPNTRLIHLEAPGSNTFEIQDIPAICAVAQEHNIITMIDNTWATPLYLKPLSLGIDLVIHSVTKYISGHSDILMGSVTSNVAHADSLKEYYRTLEIYASADDCYQVLRSIKTLGLRLQQHQSSALQIAKGLESHPLVDRVLHPALESHPQHEIWQRDFTGSSGLFGLIFKQDYDAKTMAKFVNALHLFGIGFSWGGYKSLITVGYYKRRLSSQYDGKNIIRLNIGLEDAIDLMDDLKNAFEGLNH